MNTFEDICAVLDKYYFKKKKKVYFDLLFTLRKFKENDSIEMSRDEFKETYIYYQYLRIPDLKDVFTEVNNGVSVIYRIDRDLFNNIDL